ncbi:MAG: hypothetical protein FWD48_11960 [Oscillospiraceae bacterium]|nr:hypothetical protein [Oscillospiraceae bacterium]
MNDFDVGENSVNLAIWYMNVPITIEEIKKHESRITKECRKYLIGKLCLQERALLKAGEKITEMQKRLGYEFGYSCNSMKNNATFAKAVELFYKYEPETASDFIAGKAGISCRNIVKLAKKLPKKKKRGRPKFKPSILPHMSIKNIPPYDPDSEAMSLVLTIPSWNSTIESVFMNAVLHKVSKPTRSRLTKELIRLTDTAETMIILLREK